MPAGQKRAPDLIPDGCEPPCGCWELNSGPLEEQSVLLTSEPSLQPPLELFFETFLIDCCVSFLFVYYLFLFLYPNQSFPSLFFSPSLLPLPLIPNPVPMLSSSSAALQKKAGFPWISASHGISSCSDTRHRLFC